MKWDLAELMKKALEENKVIFKSALKDDPEAIKNLNISGIIIHDSISSNQFSKWKDSSSDHVSYISDGIHGLLTERINDNDLNDSPQVHKMIISLEGVSGYIGGSQFYINYPILNGKISKTLGEVVIVEPYITEESRGMGLGTLLYMIIFWICYKRYEVKYAATHGATSFYAFDSPSSDKVWSSLRSSGILSEVRDADNHKEYLTAIGKDKDRFYQLTDSEVPNDIRRKIDGVKKKIKNRGYEKITLNNYKEIFEGAMELLNNPEEYEMGAQSKLKKFDKAKFISESKSKDYIESELSYTNKRLDFITEEMAYLEDELKSFKKDNNLDLSPEEVVRLMTIQKNLYSERMDEDYKEKSEGDGHDHYQINYNAILNYFKLFSEHHPNLCDENGNLNVKYNNVKINII